MRRMFEVVARIGDSVVDVEHTNGSYTIGDTTIVGEGVHRVGIVEVSVRSVPAPRKVGRGLFVFESAPLVFLLGSALAHLAFGLLVRAIPPVPEELTTFDLSRYYLYLKPDLGRFRWGPTYGAGDKVAGAAGTMGQHDATGAGRYHMKMTARPQIGGKGATSAGLLGVIPPGGMFGSTLSTDTFSSGDYKDDVAGGLDGDDPGTAQGSGGFGTTGTGIGGGGDQLKTVGKGGYGSIAYGSGTGGGRSLPDAPPHTFTPQTHGGPLLHMDAPIVRGELAPEIVRKALRQHLEQIIYCYERQHLDRELTITTQLTIDPSGVVTSAAAVGDDAQVADCVAKLLRTIHVPPPGEFVHVQTPFTFR
jgi:hypothetical protein